MQTSRAHTRCRAAQTEQYQFQNHFRFAFRTLARRRRLEGGETAAASVLAAEVCTVELAGVSASLL